MEVCLNVQAEGHAESRVQAAMVTDFDKIIVYFFPLSLNRAISFEEQCISDFSLKG